MIHFLWPDNPLSCILNTVFFSGWTEMLYAAILIILFKVVRKYFRFTIIKCQFNFWRVDNGKLPLCVDGSFSKFISVFHHHHFNIFWFYIYTSAFRTRLLFKNHWKNLQIIMHDSERIIFQQTFSFLRPTKWLRISIGSGKIIVEFFSAEMLFKVWNKEKLWKISLDFEF